MSLYCSLLKKQQNSIFSGQMRSDHQVKTFFFTELLFERLNILFFFAAPLGTKLNILIFDLFYDCKFGSVCTKMFAIIIDKSNIWFCVHQNVYHHQRQM